MGGRGGGNWKSESGKWGGERQEGATSCATTKPKKGRTPDPVGINSARRLQGPEEVELFFDVGEVFPTGWGRHDKTQRTERVRGLWLGKSC
jgi:hypothetical protein